VDDPQGTDRHEQRRGNGETQDLHGAHKRQ
jgi:hypothetical protein